MSTFLIFGDIFLSVLILTSFPDAEAGEDGLEDFGGGDLAGDGGEVVDGLAEVLGDAFHISESRWLAEKRK